MGTKSEANSSKLVDGDLAQFQADSISALAFCLSHFATVLVLIVLAVCGCDQSSPQPTADPREPTRAQSGLQTMKLYVGPQEVVAELALSFQQQLTGMMFRTNLAENAAMLFPLPVTQQAKFWMKNCPSALSAAYIDTEGIIQEIHDLEPYNTNSVISATDNIRFVLETPKGWFQRHQIHEGVAVVSERGPLLQTFFGKH